MKSVRRTVLSASLICGAFALAQEGQTPAATSSSIAAKDAKDTTKDTFGGEPAEQVSPSEKVRRSSSALATMRQSLKDVLSKLEEARGSRDVVKLNCVNEKLTQVKGLLRISEQADVMMQEAIAKKEDRNANHEFNKVRIAEGRVGSLRAEAEQCIGQLAFRTDENLSVDVDVPDDLPKGDPTKVPYTVIDVFARPAAASQTL